MVNLQNTPYLLKHMKQTWLNFSESGKNISRVLLSLSKIGSHHTTTGSAPPVVNLSPFTKTLKISSQDYTHFKSGHPDWERTVLYRCTTFCQNIFVDLPPFLKTLSKSQLQSQPISQQKSLDATPFLNIPNTNPSPTCPAKLKILNPTERSKPTCTTSKTTAWGLDRIFRRGTSRVKS